MIQLWKWQQMARSSSRLPKYPKVWLFSIRLRYFQPLDRFGKCQFAVFKWHVWVTQVKYPYYVWFQSLIQWTDRYILTRFTECYVVLYSLLAFSSALNWTFLNGYPYPIIPPSLPYTRAFASWPCVSSFLRLIWSYHTQCAYGPPEPGIAYEYFWR